MIRLRDSGRRRVKSPPRRDPERTRERILAAACREFSTKGFTGARVDSVARRARINKRMLYHYFGNKAGLFREVLHHKVQERSHWLAKAPADPADRLAYWFDLAARDLDWVRLLEWEALQVPESQPADARNRQQNYRRAIEQLRRAQAAGLVLADLDAGHLLLSMMALTTFPLAFPQLTRLITGRAAGSAAFRAQRTQFLRKLGLLFRPSPETTNEGLTGDFDKSTEAIAI